MAKLKKIGIIIICAIGFIGVIALLLLSAGKSKQIKKLMAALTDTWKKNVSGKEAENAQLDAAYAALTAQEKAIIQTIKDEPSLVLPPTIDPTDYQAVLKWFRELEKHYE